MENRELEGRDGMMRSARRYIINFKLSYPDQVIFKLLQHGPDMWTNYMARWDCSRIFELHMNTLISLNPLSTIQDLVHKWTPIYPSNIGSCVSMYVTNIHASKCLVFMIFTKILQYAWGNQGSHLDNYLMHCNGSIHHQAIDVICPIEVGYIWSYKFL